MQLFPALPEVVRGMFRRPEALAVCPPGGEPRERGMFLNQTANYGLSQWEATDRILMEDFNSDNSKIDAALSTLAQTVTGHTTALAQKGNCRIEYQTYTGNGGESVTVNFPQKPLLVITTGGAYTLVTLYGQACNCISAYGAGETLNTAWDGNSLTWSGTSADKICNSNGRSYPILALMAEDGA